jgi:hypothetical protein
MNTKKLLFVALMMMCAITVHALQLREGHFFKTFSDVQPMVKAAPALFDQWFALPEDTEWREVSRQTDMQRFTDFLLRLFHESCYYIHECRTFAGESLLRCLC